MDMDMRDESKNPLSCDASGVPVRSGVRALRSERTAGLPMRGELKSSSGEEKPIGERSSSAVVWRAGLDVNMSRSLPWWSRKKFEKWSSCNVEVCWGRAGLRRVDMCKGVWL